MLWESVDSATALAARFGFTDVDHAASWLEETLRDCWAHRMDRCDRLVISASNLLAWLVVDGQQVIAKCSADRARFSRLAEVDALVAWLYSKGIPVAAPVAAGDSRLRVERDGFSLGLYPVVDGDLLDVADAGQIEAAGRMLATLHESMAAYPIPFGDGRAEPNQQLIHGDFRSANILQHRAAITAILDFDEVGYRSKIAELAKAAVLLGTRYHDWRPTSPEARKAFLAAYGEIAPLTGIQRDELQRGVTAVLNHFGWT
jgi:homoserine kinase type II